MFCMSINEGEGSQLRFLSILRKIGPVAALILMLTALLLLISIMRTTYASLLNYDSSLSRLRAYPNNGVVMRPSEKFEVKAAGQKGSEAWLSLRREHFWPTTQASGFAALSLPPMLAHLLFCRGQ